MKFTIRKLKGRDFEEMFLGEPGTGSVFVTRKSLGDSLLESIEDAHIPKTGLSLKLENLVKKYLRPLLVGGDLSLFSTLDTRADAHYGADFVFRLDTGEGKCAFATIDLYSVRDSTVLGIIASRYQDRFDGLNSDSVLMRWVARNLLIRYYLQFQKDLHRFKRRARSLPDTERRENHFILTPFDINRGRGLRALAREIALSLAKQVQKKPV